MFCIYMFFFFFLVQLTQLLTTKYVTRLFCYSKSSKKNNHFRISCQKKFMEFVIVKCTQIDITLCALKKKIWNIFHLGCGSSAWIKRDKLIMLAVIKLSPLLTAFIISLYLSLCKLYFDVETK